MKILLASNHLKVLGGTETWTYTMAWELTNQGHEIEIFTFSPGLVTKKLSKFCKITNKPAKYDLALVNHNSCLEYLRDKVSPIIFTSHGVIPYIERPVKGADKCVSVSEEVQRYIHGYGFHSTVIRNGIDCEKYKPLSEINEKPKNALVLSNCVPPRVLNTISDACEKLGIAIKTRGLGSTQTWDIHEEINRADIVFALGRGCLEAMACGRNVIVYDIYGADGYVDTESMLEFRKCNCSGRRYKIDFSVDGLISEMQKYKASQGIKNREYILQHNNIQQTSRQYLHLLKAGRDECPFTLAEHDDAIKELNRIIVQKDHQISNLESRFINTKPLKVLCVAPDMDAPFIINILQPLNLLKGRDFLSYTVCKDKNLNVSDIYKHDIILFFRSSYTSTLKYLYCAKILGKPVIFGVDDNFFELGSSEVGEMDSIRLNAHSLFIKNADLVLVYSNPMLEITGRLNANVTEVVPGIDFSAFKGLERKTGNGKISIVYATSRYKRDILSKIFFPAIKRILAEYPGRVEMVFWGYTPEEFRGVPDVRLVPMVDYESYLKEFFTQGFDIGFAPLKDDVFHRSKTNTKFRDYGACMVAGIYSNVSVYSGCVVDGETGLLVDNNTESWYQAIKKLIEDDNLRESIKSRAREYVEKHYNMERVATDMHEIFKSVHYKENPAACSPHYETSFDCYSKDSSNNIITMKVPRIIWVAPTEDIELSRRLRNISKNYAYPIKLRRASDCPIADNIRKWRHFFAEYDFVVMDRIDDELAKRLTEVGILLEKKILRRKDIMDEPEISLVNMIEDMYYKEMISCQAKPYTASKKAAHQYMKTYRDYINNYLFKKTKLNRVEFFLRKKVRDPIIRLLAR